MRNTGKNRKKRIEQDKEQPTNSGKLEHVSRGITMHDKIEQPVHDAETRFRALFENANDAIFLAEAGKFVECNLKTCEMFGCTPEQIIGKTPYDPYSPEFQPDGRKSKDKAMEKIHLAMQGKPQFFEWRHNKYNGDVFDAEVFLNRLEISGTVFIQAIVRNITERKQLEDKLKNSEEKYQTLVEHVNELIYMHDPDNILTYISPQCEKITGYTVQELAGQQWTSYATDNPINKLALDMLEEARETGKPLETHQVEIRKKDGDVIILEVNDRILRNAEGDITGVVGSARNITTQKLMEQALRESENKFKSIFDNANDGILVAEPETKKFIAANKMFCEMLGYSPKEIENIGVSDIHPEEALPHVIEQYEKQVKNECNLAPNIPVKRKDGSIFYADVSSSLITLAGKAHLIGIFRDITERKKAQEELKRSKEFITNIINTLDDPFFVKDQEHRWFMLNDAACKVMGRPREELIGKSDYDLFAKEQAEKFWERDSFVLESGQTDLNEEEITWHGKVHTISTKKSLYTDSITSKKFITGIIRDITELKESEKKLRESEGKLEAMLGSLTEHMSMMDKDLNIIWANKTAMNVFGDDIVGKKCYEAYHQRNKPCEPYPCLTLRVFQDGKVHEHDTQVIDKDGNTRYFHCNANVALRDEQGMPTAVLEISEDVTDQRLAEEALRESENSYKAVVENSAEGIVVVQGQMLQFVNPALVSLIGYSEKELLTRSFIEFIHPDHREWAMGIHIKRLKGEEVPPTYEFKVLDKKGNVKWLENNGILFEWRNRPATLNFLRDITDRKKAEQAIWASESEKKSILNAISDHILFHDTDLLIRWGNEAAARSIGMTQRELVGCYCYELWHGRSESCERCPVLRAIETRSHAEGIMTTPDGKWWEIVGEPVRDRDGEIRGAIEISRDITERKQAEEALFKEKKFTEDAINAQMDTFFLFEPGTGKAIRWNKAFTDISGYTDGEIARMPASASYYSPEDLERAVAFTQNVLKDGVGTIELELICKDGRKIPTEYRVSLINDDQGEPKYIISIGRDITERKRAEEVMNKSSIIIDSTADAVITTDIAGNITFWNKGAEIIYGYQKEEAIGKPVSILYKDEDLHVLEAMIADLLEGKDLPGIEATCIDKNHQDVEILLSLTSISDEDGNITELVGITKDITERKKSEEEIERIFNMTGYMICIANLNGYFKRINSSFEQTLGYSSEELLNKSFFDFIHPDDREKTQNVIDEKLNSGLQVIGFENRYRCKDGSYKWLSWTSRPVVDEGITYAIAYDVTERKKAQQKLLEYQRQLKSLASELLLAEESERRRIATGVHDDIGQKLALAKLELQSIQATVSEPDVSASLEHACELVDKAMQDSRSLAFDLSNPVLYEVGFTAAVESLLTERMIQKSGIKTEFESKTRKLKLGQDMSIVLFQAVRELLTNVVKHANANKVKVCIDKSDHRAQVIVEDDGVGFELSGLKSPDKEKGGFGLFNVKERLEYLGGSFDIESKPGQGTRVTMAVSLESGITAS